MKDYYSIPNRLSNSAIGWFLISPKYFKAKLDGLIEDEKVSYMERGQRIHMYLLEPSEFEKQYMISDMEIPKSEQERKFCLEYISSTKKTNGEKALEAYTASYAVTGLKPEIIADKGLEKINKLNKYIKFLKSGKTPDHLISTSEYKSYQDIESLVRQHKKAKDLIYPIDDPLLEPIEVLTELPILWEHEANQMKVPCKGLLDRVIIDHGSRAIKLVDLKTTTSLGEFAETSFTKYDYGRQLAWYREALTDYINSRVDSEIVGKYKFETYIVAVSTDRKIQGVEVFKISDSTLDSRDEFIKLIVDEISWHWSNNEWEHPRAYYESEGVIEI
jgi:hypothetical protein